MNDATQFFDTVAGAGGYEIERSLRFNSSDSAYLSRTPSVAGNRKTWTWAGWAKKVENSNSQSIFSNTAATEALKFDADKVYFYSNSGFNGLMLTNAVLRDPSAWYHVLLSVDTTQATAENRANIYINGVLQSLSLSTRPSQNYDTLLNSATPLQIGGPTYLDSYLADIHFIDGQALDPTSFGFFDTNGVWQPKAYEGSYGTNGFHLPFSNNSTAAALGTDTSGNSNTWTVNNISVTAGAGNDSLVDSPTNYGTDSGAGGEVRGNYCTWNPLEKDATTVLSNGNIDAASIPGGAWLGAAFATRSGKWYYEITTVTGQYLMLGVADYDVAMNSKKEYTNTGTYYYYGSNGQLRVNGASTTFPDSTTYPYANNAVIGIAFDCDAGTINFYLNGSKVGGSSNSITGLSGKLLGPALSAGSGGQSCTANFGQRPFAYTAPSGFKALCTTNLPEPTIADGSTAFDTKLWSGNTSVSTDITGYNFSPDFVWIKNRNGTEFHIAFDTIRGAARYLYPNLTNGENDGGSNTLTAFNSDGFTLYDPGGWAVNSTGKTYVGWAWDAGDSTVTNNDGSITSQVRANAGAGFSIVTYTGSGSAATVGHGLGVAPSLVIVKNRETATNWPVWHSSIPATNFLELNTTLVSTAATSIWNNTAPTSSVISVGTDTLVNQSTKNILAYCFAPVAGYSAFGSYTGNGNADGPFVYTGFRPRWLMVKRTDTANSNTNWAIYDTTRADNPNKKYLLANTSAVEGNFYDVDMLSNGFKLRLVGDTINQTNGTYIYAAFAEHPFATSRAR